MLLLNNYGTRVKQEKNYDSLISSSVVSTIELSLVTLLYLHKYIFLKRFCGLV